MRLFRAFLVLILAALVVPSAQLTMRSEQHGAARIVALEPVSAPDFSGAAPGTSEQAPLPMVPGGTEAGAANDDESDNTSPERAGSDEASMLEVWSLGAPSFHWVALDAHAGDAPAALELSPAKRPPRA